MQMTNNEASINKKEDATGKYLQITYPNPPQCQLDPTKTFALTLNMYCDNGVTFQTVDNSTTGVCDLTLKVNSRYACGTTQVRDDINAFWTWLNSNSVIMCIIFMVLGLFIGLMGRKLFKVIVFIAGVLLVMGLVLVIFYTTFLK